jgi:hypothetical protein
VGGRQVRAVDPFDLPDWLGTEDVTWAATSTARGEPRVAGLLESRGRALDCDLLAADQAFPAPVLSEGWRTEAHRAWTYGQVLLVEDEGRLTLAVPGTSFNADLALETLSRLAKALGADPSRFAVRLRL